MCIKSPNPHLSQIALGGILKVNDQCMCLLEPSSSFFWDNAIDTLNYFFNHNLFFILFNNI